MEAVSHRDRALEVARQCGIARGRDFDAAGVTRATVKRLCDQGVLQQIGRGLYKPADAPTDSGTSLAEAARTQTRGVICLLWALQDRKSVVSGKSVSVRLDIVGLRII